MKRLCTTLATTGAMTLIASVGSFSSDVSAAAYTGTGGGPETTFNAPYRSAVGQTVPVGRAMAPGSDAEARTHRQKDLDRVLDSICVGC